MYSLLILISLTYQTRPQDFEVRRRVVPGTRDRRGETRHGPRRAEKILCPRGDEFIPSTGDFFPRDGGLLQVPDHAPVFGMTNSPRRQECFLKLGKGYILVAAPGGERRFYEVDGAAVGEGRQLSRGTPLRNRISPVSGMTSSSRRQESFLSLAFPWESWHSLWTQRRAAEESCGLSRTLEAKLGVCQEGALKVVYMIMKLINVQITGQ